MHAASAAAPRLLASRLGTPLGDRPADRRRAPRASSARAAADPPPDAGKPPKRKLNLDLDLGQVLGAIKRGEGALNLPPGRVGLFGARETFEYLADPNKFIRSRVAKYGPVFKTGFFFKPAIVFGSRAAVEEYKTFESTLPADAALPETFRELHTQYGALRQSGEEHKATRANFSAVLGRTALAHYAPILARQTRDFVQGDLASRGTLQPGYDLRQFCLRSLFELFLGAVPPEALMDRMYAYNEGLLALGKLSPEFEDGQKALDELTAFCLKHYRTVRAQGKLTDPEYFFLDAYSRATDERGEVFTDERIATTCVLMIWGAYIEAAASMGHTLWCLMRHPEAAEKVRAECRAAFGAEDLRAARVRLEDVYAKLKYAEAATKEALRVVPQTAGGLRVNPTRRTLAGYDVPAGYVLTADPRVAFLDEANFPEPDRYRPERFLEREATVPGEAGRSNANANDPDAFFPGGMGQHRCPGISLSTLMTQIFLTYMTSTFDGWSPDLEGEGSEDPEYIHVPIVIIDDKYRLKLERNWQYDL